MSERSFAMGLLALNIFALGLSIGTAEISLGTIIFQAACVGFLHWRVGCLRRMK